MMSKKYLQPLTEISSYINIINGSETENSYTHRTRVYNRLPTAFSHPHAQKTDMLSGHTKAALYTGSSDATLTQAQPDRPDNV